MDNIPNDFQTRLCDTASQVESLLLRFSNARERFIERIRQFMRLLEIHYAELKDLAAEAKRSKKVVYARLDRTPDPQKVIEQAGRTCYLSFDKMDDDSQVGFIKRLIKMGHESPLEHAYATFRIKNCSRAMTHQLVRHRLMAVSQQSQRYVDEEQFSYVIPESMPPPTR